MRETKVLCVLESNSQTMPEIIGATFPIPKSYIPRFFNEGKKVFVKPATIFKELREGMKFIFYQSHEDTGYVGEAIIGQIAISEDPITFFDMYGEDIFLTKDELKSYIEATKKWRSPRKRRIIRPKKWLAIKLEFIREYDAPIKPRLFVPISGRYITDLSLQST